MLIKYDVDESDVVGVSYSIELGSDGPATYSISVYETERHHKDGEPTIMLYNLSRDHAVKIAALLEAAADAQDRK
jgi:hypothetical protein